MPFKGYRHRPETLTKMSESQRRRPPASPGTRMKLSMALTGKPKSEQQRRTQSENMKKRYRESPEMREKLKTMRRARKMNGENNPAYKGGKVLDKNGYIRIRGTSAGRIYEHRFLMQQFLGRKLHRWEEVHHINGIKTDNRIENLFLLDRRSHSREHFVLFVEAQKLRREREVLLDQLARYKEIYGDLK